MNIIHIALGKANPNRMNGVNKVVYALMSEQQRLGMPVTFWGITPSPNENVPEHSFPVKLFLARKNLFKIDSQLSRAIEELPHDTVVHMHGGFIPAFRLLASEFKKHNIPYLITPHGTYTPGAMSNNGMVKNAYFQLFEKPLLKRAHSVQCLGYKENEATLALDQDIPTTLIPNGQNFDDLSFTYQPLKESKTLIFGYCGRITQHHKGLDLLLHGYKNYLQEGGTAQLWMIGDGEFMSELKTFIIDNALEEKIVIHGKKFGSDKLNTMANMDVFFHTSRNEGLPMAVIEAAALGVPCVVSEHTSMDKYVEGNKAGIALKENTSSEIANVMKTLEKDWQSDNLKLMGVNARNMAKQEFNWTTISNSLLSIYKSAMSA